MTTSVEGAISSTDRWESGLSAVEGIGTWATWEIVSPGRLPALVAGAVARLEARWPNTPNDETHSIDGTETEDIRRNAHAKRVLAAFNNWAGYDTYRDDFEAASTSDPIIVHLPFEGPYDRGSTLRSIAYPTLHSFLAHVCMLANGCGLSSLVARFW